MPTSFAISTGHPAPAGASHGPESTNFAVYSRAALGMELLLYANAAAREPFQVIELTLPEHRHAFHWHCAVSGLPAGTQYNWRVTLEGPDGSQQQFEVLDPFARAISHANWQRSAWSAEGRLGLRGIVTPGRPRGAASLHAPLGLAGAVIYELHVGGFTRHPSSGVKHPGTFAGLIEKIPYLQHLGITHVQLMPVMSFDVQDVPGPVAERGLGNYWGYSPITFGSLHGGYVVEPESAMQGDEFRALVDALHEAGIGVLLDIVLNHTAEGGADGPVIDFKGLLPQAFYHRDGEQFRDYTGCGNTVNANHPDVARVLADSVRIWADEYHVDGFRFDLASALVRDTDGEPMAHPPCVAAIEAAVPGLTLIAEPWDAVGLHQVGNFPGRQFCEWNDRYRDTLRRALGGEPGLVNLLATCLAGSSDFYAASDRGPRHSINFITCHDGFTLHDLVSYQHKHNEANGEGDRDGSTHNLSWNCGTEGETLDEATLQVRYRHVRNAMALLLLSQGVPMLLAGDEILRTQHGNNNAWCQDNEISWFDWRLTEMNGAMLDFVRRMIALRRRHPSLSRRHFLRGSRHPAAGVTDIVWSGTGPGEPDWNDPAGRFLAFTLAGTGPAEEPLHVMINLSDRSEQVRLPDITGRHWHVAVDTSRNSPDDLPDESAQERCHGLRWLSQPRSVVVLEGRLPAPG